MTAGQLKPQVFPDKLKSFSVQWIKTVQTVALDIAKNVSECRNLGEILFCMVTFNCLKCRTKCRNPSVYLN